MRLNLHPPLSREGKGKKWISVISAFVISSSIYTAHSLILVLITVCYNKIKGVSKALI